MKCRDAIHVIRQDRSICKQNTGQACLLLKAEPQHFLATKVLSAAETKTVVAECLNLSHVIPTQARRPVPHTSAPPIAKRYLTGPSTIFVADTSC